MAMIGAYIKGNYDGRVDKGLELTPEVLAASPATPKWVLKADT